MDTTWVIDANADAARPKWLNAGKMNRARRNHNLVILADGQVLAVGGNTNDNYTGPVFDAEIFNPAAGAWKLQPPSDPNHHRMYHSTAVLLQDGRVALAGGNNFPTVQIFRPPYITDGAPRTIITQAPTYMQYGQQYVAQYLFTGASEVAKACLIRLASTTHGFDQDQRYLPVKTYLGNPAGLVGFEAPANANIAPPGYYMLFLLTEYASNRFAPSEQAAYVRIGP